MNTIANPGPITLVEKLRARAAGETAGPTSTTLRVPVEVYTDQIRLDQERSALFLKRPLIIGHETQIPEPGDALVFDWLGLPLITIRDKSGAINTFKNVCRHRGMRLVQEEGQTCLRSMVCPYHNWTYGLEGELRNIPLSEGFSDLDKSELGLVSVSTELRHGLIWLQIDSNSPMNLTEHLAGLGQDLDTFGIGNSHYFAHSIKKINCNWKLIQDAFLDGYHVVRLHKNTVGPFFPDALSESDELGDHIRSAVARNEIFDAIALPKDQLSLRHHATFSYTVFPNSVVICHPDYTSVIGLFPQSPDETLFTHTMLTAKPPTSEKEKAHFQRSFTMIDEGVFEAEDIYVSEGTQRGLRSGANSHLLFGAFEKTAVDFHQKLNTAIQGG